MVKEGQADGSKQQQAGPALFPRLHVAETKKAGPRAPPRNKMALYEQLTVPSHRFKASPVPLPSSSRMVASPTMTTPVFPPQIQSGSYDSRYPYVPMSYVNPTIIPTMAYMPIVNVGMYGVGGSASVNASSGRSTVVDGATEAQRVPFGGETVTSTPKISSHSKHAAPRKKGKEDDDFAVPTYSSATQGSSQTRPSSSPLRGQQAPRGKRVVQRDKECVMEKGSPLCVDQVRRMRKERSMEVMSMEHKDDASSPNGRKCITVSVVDNDVDTQTHSHRRLDGGPGDSDGSVLEPNPSEIGDEEVKLQEVEAGEGVTKTLEAKVAAGHPRTVYEEDYVGSNPDQDPLSSQSWENQSCEVLEPSQARRGSSAETESSMLENLPTGSPSFRVVMDAFGQQEFWKAQRTIMSQQKLFSRQLFELHRIIEVQHLLAKSSCLAFNTDEQVAVEVEEDDDDVPVPASPVAEVPESLEGCSEKNVSKPAYENSRPVPESVVEPVYPLPPPAQQGFGKGSPWKAAPYDVNPWAARMASPYMYVPYPAPYSPGFGVHPFMGAPMPMYGQSGAIQGAGYPTWQQPGMSHMWGAQNPAGAPAAWYGPQLIPANGSAANMGVVSPACNSDRVTSTGISQPPQRSTSKKEMSKQVGEKPNVSADRTKKVGAIENFGWAKGWGRMEGWRDRLERNMVQNKDSVRGAQGNEMDCQERDSETREPDLRSAHDIGTQDPVVRSGRDVGTKDPELRFGQQSGERERVVERRRLGKKRVEQECEKDSAAGSRLEGAAQALPAGSRDDRSLQRKAFKHTRTGGQEYPWFPILFPAKRTIQQNGVIKVVPRAVSATPESAASILMSIQKERQS